jgi:DNA-binding GntR family transcriptional regulator
VRELILAGHYHPGQRLNEVELAASLGVSRGPLREALQQLSSEGLVHRIQHRGTFIPEFGVTETLELYEVREALEVMAVRLAAERTSPEAIKSLLSILETTHERLTTDPHYPLDLDFHERLVALAGNRNIEQYAREVRRQLHFALSRSSYQPERALSAYEEHLEILRAIEAGDPDRAGAAMRDHMRSGYAHVSQLFQGEQSAAEAPPQPH